MTLSRGEPPSSPRVRVATQNDLTFLVPLLTLLLTQEAEFAPDPCKQRAGLRSILKHPERGRIFVLEVDGRITGMASLVFTVSTAMGGRAALFEDFVIEPSYRGLGLGRLLLTRIIAAAKLLKIKRLSLVTASDNARAQHLYASVGFERSGMVVMRRIG